MMKKNYKQMEFEIVFFNDDDIVRTSQSDNVTEYPDFPEAGDFGG